MVKLNINQNNLLFYQPLIMIIMFGLFKKKSEKEKLNKAYQSLMQEAFVLSKTNRKLSDEKVAQANEVAKKMEALEDK